MFAKVFVVTVVNNVLGSISGASDIYFCFFHSNANFLTADPGGSYKNI